MYVIFGSDLPRSIDAVHHVHTSPTHDVIIMTCNTDFAVPDLISELAHSGGLCTLDYSVSRWCFAVPRHCQSISTDDAIP